MPPQLKTTSSPTVDGSRIGTCGLAGCSPQVASLRTDFPVPSHGARRATADQPIPAALSNRRYVEGQRLYLRSCQPEAKATIKMDQALVDEGKRTMIPNSQEEIDTRNAMFRKMVAEARGKVLPRESARQIDSALTLPDYS
jgi:hypothetical protein